MVEFSSVPLFMHWSKLSRSGIEGFGAATNVLAIVYQGQEVGETWLPPI